MIRARMLLARWQSLLSKWPRIEAQYLLAAIGALVLVVFIAALFVASDRGERKDDLQETTQQDYSQQIDALTKQVEQLANSFAAASGEAERAKVQANASVDQLVKSGEKPIIAAPEIVTVPTTPSATTTTLLQLPPIVVTPPRDEPAPTTDPPPTTTTTQPNVEPPPEETTTTTTEPPPETTTTTTTELPPEVIPDE